jgi:archaellum component FlaC
MMMEKHSHKKFWLAIVILAIVAITFFGATSWVWHELNETQNTLLRVESELETAQTQWADAEHELNETQNSLLLVGSELKASETQLADVKAELATVEAGLATVEAELATVEAELATVEIELNTSKERIESLEATLSNLQVNYARLTTGYGYVLRDPSYQEMREFLARDATSERKWVRGEYTCVDFARDVKTNAARKRIRSAFVLIEHPEAGHAIVAFYTTDRGLVFIEPQLDWKVEPRIGQRYYQSLRPPPRHHVPRPGHDDTITRIIIIW